MPNPNKDQLIKAKETNPNDYDDILGTFRAELVRKVQQAIVYHKDNAIDPALEYYRAGVSDTANAAPPGFSEFIDGRWWKKNGAHLVIEDVFAGPNLDLPDNGQVPEDTGGSIDGQISYFDVSGGTPIQPGDETKSKPNSVAHHVMEHTHMMTRVRKCSIIDRMAVTSKNWNSKTYPHTFSENGKNYEATHKGDDLKRFEDLYAFQQQSQKDGMTHMAEPFRSAPLWAVFAQTLVGDGLRGPRIDNSGSGGGPDPFGTLIVAGQPLPAANPNNLITVFNRMAGIWDQAKNIPAALTLDYCHSSCHASCHSSRSRR